MPLFFFQLFFVLRYPDPVVKWNEITCDIDFYTHTEYRPDYRDTCTIKVEFDKMKVN